MVVAGFARGLLTDAELNPVEGVHEYELPATAVSPIVAPDGFVTQVLVNAVPALTVGCELTTTVTEFVALHIPVVPVTV